MELLCKAIKTFLMLPFSKKKTISYGPNSLEELLTQFNQPIKEKTEEDIIRDYKIKETLAALEVDMLKMDPALAYRGHHSWTDEQGTKFYDWVPCIARPEVIYCSFNKN